MPLNLSTVVDLVTEVKATSVNQYKTAIELIAGAWNDANGDLTLKSLSDEIKVARGSLGSLDARLDVIHTDSGVLKANTVGKSNMVSNVLSGRGDTASRPAPSKAGFLYHNTETKALERDNGTGYDVVGGMLTMEQVADLTDGGDTTLHTHIGLMPGNHGHTGTGDGGFLAPNVVGRDQISAGAVSEAKIAAGAVSEAKIAAGAVSEAKIAAGAVSEAKIAAGAVSEEKIAAGAVSEEKIAAGAVSEEKIASLTLERLRAIGLITQVSIQESDNTDAAWLRNFRVDGSALGGVSNVILRGSLWKSSAVNKFTLAVYIYASTTTGVPFVKLYAHQGSLSANYTLNDPGWRYVTLELDVSSLPGNRPYDVFVEMGFQGANWPIEYIQTRELLVFAGPGN